MAKQNTMDLTQGRPIKQILLFSLPLIMGTLFQQLYSFVDTVMVGRLISEKALAAVGTTYSLIFLTLGFVQCACVGFGMLLDYVLIVLIPMGVAGTALATVLSQLVSGCTSIHKQEDRFMTRMRLNANPLASRYNALILSRRRGNEDLIRVHMVCNL